MKDASASRTLASMGREGAGGPGRRSLARRVVVGVWLGAVVVMAGGLVALTALPGAGRSAAGALQRERLLSDAASSLRAARVAAEAGNAVAARELLSEVATRHSVVADYAELLLVQLIAEQGSAAEAASRAEQALGRHPESPLASDFYTLLGAARLDLGDDPRTRLRTRTRTLSSGMCSTAASLHGNGRLPSGGSDLSRTSTPRLEGPRSTKTVDSRKYAWRVGAP